MNLTTKTLGSYLSGVLPLRGDGLVGVLLLLDDVLLDLESKEEFRGTFQGWAYLATACCSPRLGVLEFCSEKNKLVERGKEVVVVGDVVKFVVQNV